MELNDDIVENDDVENQDNEGGQERQDNNFNVEQFIQELMNVPVDDPEFKNWVVDLIGPPLVV